MYLVGAQAAAGGIEVTDDRGKLIELNTPALRIISLAPHITENLFAIGAGDNIVGVTSYSNYPEAANDIELVGTYKQFDVEKIIVLEPDITIGWVSGNPDRQVKLIERFDIPVFLSEPRSFQDVAEEIRKLGQLTGNNQIASRVANDFLGEIESLSTQYGNKQPLDVFYQVWDNPMITLNGEHLVSRLIEGCGGRNVFASLPSLAPRISTEAVIEKDPDVIIASGVGSRPPEWLDEWYSFAFLKAVGKSNLFHVNPDLIERHTVRLADGMKAVCQILETARKNLKL